MTLKTLGQENSATALRIFDNFRVDSSLPKYVKLKEAEKETREIYKRQESSITVAQGSWAVSTNGSSDEDDESEEGGWDPKDGHRNTRWRRFKAWLKLMTTPGIELVPVWYVFENVLSNPEELKVFEDRNNAFQVMIENAKRMGQHSLVKSLEAEREVRKFENFLFAKGRKRYISEAQLLKFVAKCEKGLCLNWITNFARPIPADVMTEKLKCDVDELFDNYVVLHYDPEEKATTAADRAADKDPILFGVIKGSRRLYFVGDWTDELCDLTLQQIVDKLGEPLEMK